VRELWTPLRAAPFDERRRARLPDLRVRARDAPDLDVRGIDVERRVPQLRVRRRRLRLRWQLHVRRSLAVPPVSEVRLPRIEIDGHAASIEEIWALDLSSSGHFTAMQVRDRRTLGMDFHLARLDGATRELFGIALDEDRVRGSIRDALADDITDASVRVNVFWSDTADDLSVLVSVRPPASAPADPQHLQTVEYRRPAAHIKHASSFGQGYYAGLAHANGFHEALFVGTDGHISEGAITNIGFVDGDAIVWPDAPALRGIMMQVLQRELDRAGIAWRYGPVPLSDLASFDGAFVTNSHGIATVARIDDRSLPTDASLMRTAKEVLAAAPLDPI
jgi:branched-subunit amino acid aminotransferase/4-amino-4-deoxychorismate lyase